MPDRNLVWILGILVAIVVVLPLLTMVGMMAMGMSGSMMGMSGNMMLGTSVLGLIWMLAGAGLVIALVVLLVRGVTRT